MQRTQHSGRSMRGDQLLPSLCPPLQFLGYALLGTRGRAPAGDQISPLECIFHTGIAAQTGKALRNVLLFINIELWSYCCC